MWKNGLDSGHGGAVSLNHILDQCWTRGGGALTTTGWGGGKGASSTLTTLILAQRGQASVTLQPDSGLFNWLGAGVVKLTE